MPSVLSWCAVPANVATIFCWCNVDIKRVAISNALPLNAILISTRGSAIAEEPRDALRLLKYYVRFLTELLTRSSANPEEPCEHTVS